MKSWQFWIIVGLLLVINANVGDDIVRISSSIVAFVAFILAAYKYDNR